jgi:hypothetical protein
MRLEELERDLRAERPEPDPGFARRLDDWAAAGFPRNEWTIDRDISGKSRTRSLFEWFRALPPRRIVAPVGAAAVLLVVGAVAISQSDLFDGGFEPTSGGPATTTQAETGGGGAADATSLGARGEAAPAAEPARADRGGEFLSDAPATAIAPIPPPGGGGGGIAAGTEQRIVDATASLVLGAEAGEIQDVANRVVEVTDRHDGIVERSQVTSDQAGARATFELAIPAKRLDAALADLSGLADVISRTEGGEDITARAVRAQRALAETLEDIQQARTQLIRTDDPEQRRIIRSRIRLLDATADQQRAELAGVHRQGRFATVAVEVTSNETAASDGGWSLDEAADDALDVLTAVGGVLLISLAVMVPLAALAGLGWFGWARARRASRERALDR